MPQLRAPDEYGVREIRYGGAPMSREAWHDRHPSPRCEVTTWTVIADNGRKIPHLMCFTCWTLGIERAAYEAIPVEIPAPVAEAPLDDKTSSTKGPKR